RPVDLTLPMVLKPRVPATNAPRAGSAPPPGLRLEVTRPDSSVAAADLTPGVWSDFLEVHFEVTPVVKVHGIFKALLTHYDTSDPKFPKMGLYISPINFSPKSPPLAISYPAGWTGELAEEYGNFKTVGWPSETWGVNDGVLTEQAFMDDIDQTQEKWEEMLFGTLAKGDWDVLFAVSQQTDHIGHMFYRFLDPKHPAHDAERAKDPFYSEALLRSYQRADQVVGKVMAEYLKDDRTILLVVSDHGFNSFRRAVNINRWLINHGFMALKLPEGQGTETLNTAQLFAGDEFFKDVDWTKTKAYAMGLGQIYLNLKDREGQGIVEPGAEAEQVKRDITAGLMQMKDPKDGSPIMRSVFDGAKIYHGQAMAQAPDLVTGFHDGFRVSWQTALGGAPAEEVEDNNLPWSGDHCSFDPEITMGVCFTNWRIDKADPSVLDIAPSVLKALGIPQPAEMDGRPLFETLPSREG
ncbi:MAG TPA: alkaline phosphatase family protein, partial [bacterium]|nr:alkaline phosphatase family protein [bacterium]